MITDLRKIQNRFTDSIISIHTIISLINVRIVIPNIKNILLNETKLFLFLFNYDKYLEEYTNYNKNKLYYDPYYREIKYVNFFHQNNWIQTNVKKEDCLRNLYNTLRIQSYYETEKYYMNYTSKDINYEKRKFQNDISYLYKMLDYCVPFINCLNNHLNQNNSKQFNSNIYQLLSFKYELNNYDYYLNSNVELKTSNINITIFNTFIYAFKNNLPVTLPMICEKLNIKFDPKYNIYDRPLHHIILEHKNYTFSTNPIIDNNPITYLQSPKYVYDSVQFKTKPITPPDRFIPKLS